MTIRLIAFLPLVVALVMGMTASLWCCLQAYRSRRGP